MARESRVGVVRGAARPVGRGLRASSRSGYRLDAVCLTELPLLVLDTETTGLGEAHLVELAAIRLDPGTAEQTFCSLVRPPFSIPPMAIAVHGITDEMVRYAPAAREPLLQFLRFSSGALMVAHNAPFDLKVLAAELFRNRLPLPRTYFLDSLRLSRLAFPELTCHTLEHLAHVHGLSGGGEHRALADARITAEVLRRCLARLGGDTLTLGELLARHGAPYSFDRAINTSRLIHGPVRRLSWDLSRHGREVG